MKKIIPPSPDLSWCTGCQEFRPRTDFYKNRGKRGRDGLQTNCKACMKESTSQWYQEQKERLELLRTGT